MSDVIIGIRCYAIEPDSAPQDNAREKLYIIEREQDSGVFDGVGFHEDINGVRTPMHATSKRVINEEGVVSYNRVAYGVLGSVLEEIDHASIDDVEAMFNTRPQTAIFVSYSTLQSDDWGILRGTFRADVWHHDFNEVKHVSAINTGPGIIYSIPEF